MRLRDITTTGCYCRLLTSEDGRTRSIERVDVIGFTTMWMDVLCAFLYVPVEATPDGPSLMRADWRGGEESEQ